MYVKIVGYSIVKATHYIMASVMQMLNYCVLFWKVGENQTPFQHHPQVNAFNS